MSLSVVILTLDEEINLAGCLESVRWCDDVVVLDSFSRDRTGDIALQSGARLEMREFDNYAGQRNHALHAIQYKHEWVLMLDADERVPDDLRHEMLAAAAGSDRAVTLFRMRRKDHLLGRWIRGSSGYPTWFGRLMRPARVRVEREINEEYHTDGDIRELQAHLHHFPFNKGFSAWIQKHDRYSTMEAQLRVAQQAVTPQRSRLLSRDPTERRRALKSWLYRAPARPLIVFCGVYFGKGGLFEGRAGLTFSLLRAWYEFMIDAKTLELRRRAQGLPV